MKVEDEKYKQEIENDERWGAGGAEGRKGKESESGWGST